MLGVMLGSAPWDSKAFAARLATDGFSQQADSIKGEMLRGILRSLWFAFLAAAGVVAGMMALKPARRYAGMICGVLLLGACVWDLVGVNRRYVSYYDPSTVYRSNVVMDYLKEYKEYRVKFIPLGFQIFNQWNSLLVPYLFVKSADMPAESRRSPDIQAFYDAFQRQPAKMWSLLGIRHLVVDRNYAGDLKKLFNDDIAVVKAFDFQQDRNTGVVTPVFSADPSVGRFVIMENRQALSCPKWYSKAQNMKPADMPALMASSQFNIQDVVLVEQCAPDIGQATGSAKVVLKRYDEIEVEVDVNADGAGWLLFNDYIDGKWKASIDGEPVGIVRANAIFKAVPVHAGQHVVTLEYAGSELSFWLPITVLIGLLCVAAGTLAFQLWNNKANRA